MPDITVYHKKNGKQSTSNAKPSSGLRRGGRIDFVYLTIVIALVVIGLTMLLSASYAKAIDDGNSGYYYFSRQLIFVLLGSAAAVFFLFVPDALLKIGGQAVSWVCLVLLVSLYFIPTSSNERRWIYLTPSIQLQPSEFAKIALIIVLATFFAMERHPYDRKRFPNEKKYLTRVALWNVYPYLLCIAYFFLILFETHLSGAGLIAVISLSMIIAARKIKIKWLVIVLAIILLVCVVVLMSNEYMLNRVKVLFGFSTEGSSAGDEYQINQSYLAIGSGGLTGVGLGKSRQKYLYLPEPQNDFIFAIACEELGFIGATLIVVLFVLFIWRGITIALKSRDRFRSLVALGITCNLGAQIVLNLMVVTGLFPVTGISLPFFSYGGTAIFTQLAEVGMMLRISRFADLEPLPVTKDREELSKLPQ